MQTNDGAVLKAVQSPPRGLKELEFYKRLFTANNINNVDEINLKKFLPLYYGTIVYDNS